jgi:hypothetical protein
MWPRKKGTPERINWPLRVAMAIGFGILALILKELSYALSR